jgi:uncharacterized phage protein (TIGR01671 family)
LREILFRGKRIDNGEWEFGNAQQYPMGKWSITNECMLPPDSDPMWRKSLIVHDVKPETVSQFTGFYDKNGARIFENDIISFFPTCDYKVTFHNGAWGGKDTSGWIGRITKFDCDRGEVVGNIFDNEWEEP